MSTQLKKVFSFVTVTLGVLATMLSADDSLTKTILISDIHMCDYDSIHTPDSIKPYGWLGKDRANMLAKFLNKIADENDPPKKVKEVVILGDLFDGWVCPFDMDPLYGVTNVDAMFKKMGSTDYSKNPINQPVITALKKLAEQNRLVYVPGNHDMLLTEETLKQIIPGIQYKSKYTSEDEIVVAEHGHNYCLFNAPDNFDDPSSPHVLPLGYFMTRAVSYRVAHSAAASDAQVPTTTPELISSIYTSPATKESTNSLKSWDIPFSGFFYRVMLTMLGIELGSVVRMNNVDNFEPMKMWSGVYDRYKNSYKNWPKSNLVDPETALLSDAGLLSSAAYKVYANHNQYRIIIFGHTHKAIVKILNTASDRKKIYANTGSWIDRVDKCTYIETEKCGTTYKVRLYQYKGSAEDADLLQEEELEILI